MTRSSTAPCTSSARSATARRANGPGGAIVGRPRGAPARGAPERILEPGVAVSGSASRRSTPPLLRRRDACCDAADDACCRSPRPSGSRPLLAPCVLCSRLAVAVPRRRRPCRSLSRLGCCPRLPVRLRRDHRPARRMRPTVSRGRRRDAAGDVYVADQLSYVVQKFNSSGQFGSGGPTVAGTASSGRSAAWRPTPRGTYTWSTPATTGSRSSTPKATSSRTGAIRAANSGDFDFGSSQNYTQPPGGGIAVAGDYVYVADSGNNRIERFNLEGEEPIAWGDYGNGPGQFSYPRGIAANASEVIVTDDDNHRIEKFGPRRLRGAAGSNGNGPGQFGFPYGVALDAAGDMYVADDINHRIVKLDPAAGFAGAGAATAPNLASSRSRARWPATRRATPTWRTPPTTASRCSTRTATTCARSAPPRAAPGADGAARAGDRPDRAAARLRHRRQPHRAVRPRQRRLPRAWTTAGATPGLDAPAGIAVDPRGSVYVADPGNARIVHLWGDGTFLVELGGPAELGGAELNGADRSRCAPRGHRPTSPTATTTACSSTARRARCRGVGSGRRRRRGRRRPGRVRPPATRSRSTAPETSTSPTPTTTASSSSPPPAAVIDEWGSRGTGRRALPRPDRHRLDAAGRVYVVDSENNRVRCSTQRPLLASGACGGRARRVLPAERDRGRTATATCTSPTPTTTASSASTRPPPPATGCLAAGRLAAPAERGARAAGRAPAHRRRARAPRAGAGGQLPRGCKILVTATLSPLGRACAVTLVAAARTLPPAVAGPRAPAASAPRALRRLRARSAAEGDARKGADRRRRADRPAHHDHQDLHRRALGSIMRR